MILRSAVLSGSSVWLTRITWLSITEHAQITRLETEETGPSRPGTRVGGALAFPDCCLFCDLLCCCWASDLGRLVTRPGGRGTRLKGDMRPGWDTEERLAAASLSSWARYTGSDSRLKGFKMFGTDGPWEMGKMPGLG
jgi:hypothetical protein